jgi:predicted alpha/beta superfamily hydrolase
MKTFYKKGDQTLVILITGNEENTELYQAFPYSFLAVCSEDWNRELSPWPAAQVLKGGGDFQGEADQTLSKLLQDPILRQPWQRRIICGYSLAGLFAMYACTKTDLFDACASVSGSLWYPDFITYLRTYPMQCCQVYLSLGNLEKNSKQPLLHTVEEKTKEVQALISQYTSVTFEMNEGNHFKDPNGRMIKALKALQK